MWAYSMKFMKKIYLFNTVKLVMLGILFFFTADSFHAIGSEIRTYPIIVEAVHQHIISVSGKVSLLRYFILVSIFDNIMLYLISELNDKKLKETVFFYILSVPLWFSMYFVFEYDYIAVTLLLGSILALFRRKHLTSAILLGLGVLSKTPVLLALPLLLMHVYKGSQKENQLSNTLKYFISAVFPIIIVGLVIRTGVSANFSDFYNSNSLLMATSYSVGNLDVYLTPLAIMMIYLRYGSYRKHNKQLLLDFLGLLYLALVILIPPEPQWYLWSIVFIAILFSNHTVKYNKLSLFYLLVIIVYSLYFIYPNFGFYTPSYFDQFSFTILEATMIATGYIIYKIGIKSNRIYSSQKESIIIGIGGDSGAGKTTLKNAIIGLLGDENIVDVEADGDHKWERGDDNWDEFTHLNPKANYLHKQAVYLKNLKRGNKIKRVEYDHKTGQFTKPMIVNPNDYILLAGLHPFYLPQMRRLVDIKIFLDTDEKLRRHWKVIRDTSKRGYSLDKIMTQINSRMSDAQKYIYPQKNFSDLVVKVFSRDEFDIGNSDFELKLSLEIKVRADLDLDDIIIELLYNGYHIEHCFDDDLRYQTIVLDNPIEDGFIKKSLMSMLKI